jgi:hypothetical protein
MYVANLPFELELLLVRLDVDAQCSPHASLPPLLLRIEPCKYVRVHLHRYGHLRLLG